jgi:hypothetical protein
MKPGVWKTALGVFLILVVDVLWVGSSFFVKYVIFGDVLNISNGNVSADGYDIPYFLTYLGNSLFIVYLPIVGARNLVERAIVAHHSKRRVGFVSTAAGHEAESTPASSTKLLVSVDGVDQAPLAADAAAATTATNPRPTSVLRHTMKWALIVCPFWFAANCTYNVSQGMTSVTSNTIISSTSGESVVFLLRCCRCFCVFPLCLWHDAGQSRTYSRARLFRSGRYLHVSTQFLFLPGSVHPGQAGRHCPEHGRGVHRRSQRQRRRQQRPACVHARRARPVAVPCNELVRSRGRLSWLGLKKTPG